MNYSLTYENERIVVCGQIICEKVPTSDYRSMVGYIQREVLNDLEKKTDTEVLAKRLLHNLKLYPRLNLPLVQAMEDFTGYLKSRLGKTVTISSYRRFKNATDTFRDYVRVSGNKYVRDVCCDFMDHFYNYVVNTRKNSPNTAATHCASLQKMMAHELGNLRIPRDTVAIYRAKKVRTLKPFITKKEVDKIETVQLAEANQQLVRWLFVLQCYTGLAFCDLKLLKQDNFFTSEKGLDYIVINRSKTGKRALIPLLDKAQLALKEALKIKKLKRIKTTSGIFQVHSATNYNRILKRIGKAANIKTILSTHVGRRTFASSIALHFGASMETVSRVLGHSQLAETYRYARVTNEKINREMKGKI